MHRIPTPGVPVEAISNCFSGGTPLPRSLTDCLHQRLDEEGVRVASPRMRDQRSSITIIEMRKAPDVVKSLAEKKIIVSARGEGLRVSLHVFNNFDDIDHLVAVALRELPFLVTRIAR
jgi:selenocysteine lyase/cysteine desulfurase